MTLPVSVKPGVPTCHFRAPAPQGVHPSSHPPRPPVGSVVSYSHSFQHNVSFHPVGVASVSSSRLGEKCWTRSSSSVVTSIHGRLKGPCSIPEGLSAQHPLPRCFPPSLCSRGCSESNDFVLTPLSGHDPLTGGQAPEPDGTSILSHEFGGRRKSYQLLLG